MNLKPLRQKLRKTISQGQKRHCFYFVSTHRVKQMQRELQQLIKMIHQLMQKELVEKLES